VELPEVVAVPAVCAYPALPLTVELPEVVAAIVPPFAADNEAPEPIVIGCPVTICPTVPPVISEKF
jgi:hypothetical protein